MDHIADQLRGLAIPVKDLTLDPANARKHSERNLQAITQSLKRFGQRQPIVVQKQGMIVRAGNGRVMAAKELGWEHVAAVVVDEANIDAVAYAIADNRTAELAEWDDTALAAVLDELRNADMLDDVGYSSKELDRLLDDIAKDQLPSEGEDDIPEDVEAVCKLGDLWQLGNHRLLCGDSTDPESYKRLLGGEAADLLVTDPPYGVGYGGKNSFLNAVDGGRRNTTDIANDGLDGDKLREFLATMFDCANDAMRPGACAYVFASSGDPLKQFLLAWPKAWHYSIQLVWVKNQAVFGRMDYHGKYESILYGWKLGKGHTFHRTEGDSTVWEHDKPRSSKVHPTMKPVGLFERVARAATDKGDAVLDPFCGSGTTIIACENAGRKGYGIELSPHYCDIIISRWEDQTGGKAVKIQ